MTRLKYALVIGAGSESVFAIETAKKMGFYVIAFDGNPYAEGLKYADKQYVVDIRDAGKIIDILRDIKPDVILPVPIGRYLITTGFLNEYYGLKGPYELVTNLCTDKYLFHAKLSQNKLRNIQSFLFSKGETFKDFANINYPIITKPRFGSGNRDVVAFFSKEEFESNFLAHAPFDEDFIIEELIQGVEYGVDAVAINGHFDLILLREKKLTPYPYSQSVGYYSVSKNKKLIKKAEDYLKKIIKVLNVKNGLIHADLMYKDDYFTAIEMSMRPSGHNLHNNFTIRATGINALKEYLNFVTKKMYNFKPKFIKNLFIRFFDFENCKIVKIPDFDSLKNKFRIIDYKCSIENKTMNKVKDGHSIIDRGYVIIEGNSRIELDSNAEKILKEFQTTKI